MCPRLQITVYASCPDVLPRRVGKNIRARLHPGPSTSRYKQQGLPTRLREQPLTASVRQPSTVRYVGVLLLHLMLITSRAQIQQFVDGLFALNQDLPKFKVNLRDFLIQLKEFSGDNADLYAEDREEAQKAANTAERERLAKVGGLLKPADIDQDDEL